MIKFGDGSGSGGTNFLDATPDTITLTSGELFLFDAATTTISGPGQSLLSISGNNASRVFDLNQGASALSGLTITGGNGVGNGTGLFNGGTAWLTDCTITDNSSGAVGGGVGNIGTLTLTNCTVSNNSAVLFGGGLFNGPPSGTLTLIDCTVSNNSAVAGTGGGLVNFATLTVTNCTISGNSAAGGGGDLVNTGEGTATLANCTFSGNKAGGQGGGIVNDGMATLNMTSSTVSGNSALDGGGIDLRPGTLTLGNTIVSANTAPTAPDIDGSISTDLGHNLLGAALSGTTSGSGNVYTDTPMLGALADNGGPTQTRALLTGSPAIDAGDNALAVGITTDQRGSPRIVGGTVDIGAFEVQNQTPTLTVPAAQTAYEDVDLAFSGANAITVGDPDGDILTVTLNVSHGTLTLGTTAGLNQEKGTGTFVINKLFSRCSIASTPGCPP